MRGTVSVRCTSWEMYCCTMRYSYSSRYTVTLYSCSVRCSHVQCVNHHCTEMYKHSEMYSYSVRVLLHYELYICSVLRTFVRCTVTQRDVQLQCEIIVALWVVHMQCVMYICEMYCYTVIGTVTVWDVQWNYCCTVSCIFAVWDAQKQSELYRYSVRCTVILWDVLLHWRCTVTVWRVLLQCYVVTVWDVQPWCEV